MIKKIVFFIVHMIIWIVSLYLMISILKIKDPLLYVIFGFTYGVIYNEVWNY